VVGTAAADEWLEAYEAAWISADPDAAAELFTADASYQFDPFCAPAIGREAIRDAVATAFSVEHVCCLEWEVVAEMGDRKLVRYRAAIQREGDPMEVVGLLVVDLDRSGLCCRLEEYWVLDLHARIINY
jgi:nuclear transport factor 2 (NTF2) superfamily protein